MLLFRPPLQKFGLAGVVPGAFAPGSPLSDDQPGLANRAQAEWLWTLLPPLPTGTTTVGDTGSYSLTDAGAGVHAQAYRGLVMPLSGAPVVYEDSIVTGAAQINAPFMGSSEQLWGPVVAASLAAGVAPPFLVSAEQMWSPNVSSPSAGAQVFIPSFDCTEEFGSVAVDSTAAAVVQVAFSASDEFVWAPTVEGLVGGFEGSLITMEQADKYVLEFYGADHAWFSVAASRKRIALRRATQYLLANYCIKPIYLDPLHKNVIAADAEAAIRALSGALFEDQNAQHVESVTVGPISRKMSAPRAGGQKRFTVIDQLLRGLTCNSPGMVRFERA